MGRVFVIGSLNLDTVLAVERHPVPGETVSSSSVATLWGGKGANQAVAAARAATAGSPVPVIMVGCVGADETGARYRDRLAGEGVDVSRLRVVEGAQTGAAYITVDRRAENTIVVAPGANARMAVADVAALDDAVPGDVVVTSLEVPLEVVVAAAHASAERGARFILNLSPVADVPQELLAIADPLIVNEHEVAHLRAMLTGEESVLVTRGAAGSVWGDAAVPAKKDVDVVDTTGAGDAYCGALAVALAEGRDRTEAMTAASEAAGLAVARWGAQ